MSNKESISKIKPVWNKTLAKHRLSYITAVKINIKISKQNLFSITCVKLHCAWFFMFVNFSKILTERGVQKFGTYLENLNKKIYDKKPINIEIATLLPLWTFPNTDCYITTKEHVQ